MRGTIRVLALAGSGVLTASAQQPPPPVAQTDVEQRAMTSEQLAQGHFDMGVRFMAEKKYAGAVEAFQRAVDAKPDFVAAYNNWGIALVQVGKQGVSPQQKLEQWQLAAEEFGKAAELKPDERATYMLWSETLVLIGDLPIDGRLRLSCYQGAVEKCRKAVELAPQDWETYNKWAAILSVKLPEFAMDDKARLRLYQEAADLFSKAAERARFSGEVGPVYANWGSALVRASRMTTDVAQKQSLLRDAMDKFERSTRAIPSAAATYAMWGSALVELGKFSKMRSDFREGIDRLNTSLALNENDPATLYNLARGYALMDNPVMAVQNLKRCFDVDANKVYFSTAPTDPDLASLRDEANFQELFNAQGTRGVPAYNPPLRDTPR
jgi:tetratricopeptide (TPR) repeat protein